MSLGSNCQYKIGRSVAHLIIVILGRLEVFVVIVIFHLIAFILGLLSNISVVDDLAASASTALNDIVLGDRLEVARVIVVLVVCIDVSVIKDLSKK